MSDDRLRQHAVQYAAGGLPIFPVNPANKEPLVSQKRATTAQEVVAEWWQRWSSALIGHRVALEQFLLDIDPRHGGDRTWEALEDEFGPIRVGRMHFSGRGDGGFHAWFLRPNWLTRISAKRLDLWAHEHEVGQPVLDDEGKEVGWTAGIDLLLHNWRYTILPPSPHPDTGQPYQWREHNSEVGELLVPVAELLIPVTESEDGDNSSQTPGVPLSVFEHSDSIADWVSATMTWNEILVPHGWTLAEGDGDADGSLWRHPSATAKHSASVKHGCLFVYSPNTPLEQTEPDDTHGYKRFRAWAQLEYGGDLSAAAKAARARKTGSTGGAQPGCNLPDEFWQRLRPCGVAGVGTRRDLLR